MTYQIKVWCFRIVIECACRSWIVWNTLLLIWHVHVTLLETASGYRLELPFFVTILLVSLNLHVPRRKLSNKSIFIHTAPFNYYEFWLNHANTAFKTSELAISIKKCEVSLLKECMYVCKHTFEVNLYSVKKMRQKVKSQV